MSSRKEPLLGHPAVNDEPIDAAVRCEYACGASTVATAFDPYKEMRQRALAQRS
jgi:hypothetical protein